MISPAPAAVTSPRSLELFVEYRGEADAERRLELRNRIVVQHLGLVRQIVQRLTTKVRLRDDLYSEGVVGLLEAVRAFDPGRGYQFSTFATSCIRNRLFRLLKRESRFQRTGNEERETTISETVCDEPSLDQEEMRSAVRREVEKLPPRDRKLLGLRFGLDRHGETHSFREIAEQSQLSKERVRQLVSGALDRMRSNLDDFAS